MVWMPSPSSSSSTGSGPMWVWRCRTLTWGAAPWRDHSYLSRDSSPWMNNFTPRGAAKSFNVGTTSARRRVPLRHGVPETCFLRPVSSVTALPGGTQATYYLQSKGHWFWAFSQHEGTSNPQVTWIRGWTPLQWRLDYAGNIHIGVSHVNDYQFVQGLYLNIGDRKFPLLYMERPPRCSNRSEQLHLLACSCVPCPVEATLHPSVLVPHRMPAAGGPVADPSCKHMMWQEGENGPVTFQVQNMMFWGVDGSHSTGSWARCVGT